MQEFDRVIKLVNENFGVKDVSLYEDDVFRCNYLEQNCYMKIIKLDREAVVVSKEIRSLKEFYKRDAKQVLELIEIREQESDYLVSVFY